VNDEESSLITKFICGLFTPINKELDMFEMNTLEYAYQKAKIIEVKRTWNNPNNYVGANLNQGKKIVFKYGAQKKKFQLDSITKYQTQVT
jgi:hypothetical protein